MKNINEFEKWEQISEAAAKAAQAEADEQKKEAVQLTGDEVVRFRVSLNLNGCDVQDEMTLNDLGWEGETGESLNEFLNRCYETFLENNLDGGAWLADEE